MKKKQMLGTGLVIGLIAIGVLAAQKAKAAKSIDMWNNWTGWISDAPDGFVDAHPVPVFQTFMPMHPSLSWWWNGAGWEMRETVHEIIEPVLGEFIIDEGPGTNPRFSVGQTIYDSRNAGIPLVITDIVGEQAENQPATFIYRVWNGQSSLVPERYAYV